MPNWEKIRSEWETSNITFKNLANKHGVKLGTLKSRRSREQWNRDATSNKDATSIKRDATEKDATKKSQTSSNKRKKRSGNPNPVKQFTKRNSAARKHGLYAKYFNESQKDIMDDFKDYTIADQLWLQIDIKFSAIVQLQRVMWVDDKNDTLKDVEGQSDGDGGHSQSYKVVYAFEQYESYIRAQARAMSEYRGLIKQFLQLAPEEDERRLKLELMQANIDKLKAETKKDESDASQTIILTNEDEMRRVIEERKASENE